jgi:hypothetical protein
VYGTAPDGIGVIGKHTATTGTAAGVEGDTASTDPFATGVLGQVAASARGVSVAVRGVNGSTADGGIGVEGTEAGSGIGILGSSQSGTGVWGQSLTGYAGYFKGNARITLNLDVGGNLNVTGTKNFRIDDPLDPANKYLVHAAPGR